MRIINNVVEDVIIGDLTLGKLVIPEGVVKIAEGALSRVADYVTEVYVADSVKEIESRVFKNLKNATHINLGNGVETLGDEVFANCFKLTNSNLPDSVKSVGQRLYFNCRSLETVELSKSMSVVSDFMFANCRKLKTMTVTDNIEFIGDFAYYNSGLRSINFAQNSKLKQIGDSAYANCTGLRSCRLPDSVLVIKKSAYNNSGLVNFVVPPRMSELTGSVLNNCKNLKNVTIPASLKNVLIKLSPKADVTIVLRKDKRIKLSERLNTNVLQAGGDNNGKEQNVVRINSKDNFKVIYLNKSVFVFDNNEIIPIEYKKLINTKNFNLLLEQNKMDTYYYWMRKLEGAYGKSILIPPSAEEMLSIPESYVDNYISARKIFNSFYSKIKYHKPAEVSGLIKLAMSVGMLERNPAIRNTAYNFLNDYIIEGNKINKEHYASLNHINVPENFNFNGKLLDLLKDVITKTENSNINFTFIADTVNNFNKIIEFKRHPNYEFVKEFFKFKRYDNVKPETEELARIASSFALPNSVFNVMSELHVKAKHNRVKGLLDLLVDMNDYQAEKETELHNNLIDALNADFTFEWLRKDSPYTPMLAYITDSCAKPGSNANSIFVDSILKQDIQNLVIRNKNNTIIAKSTAHLDINEHVLIFNNVEINHNFLNRANETQKQGVYEAYMRGVEAMVTTFNEKAKQLNKPEIERVCVGATITNDLGSVIEKYHNLAMGKQVYPYRVFNGYLGDSSSQYVLWEKSAQEKIVDSDTFVKTK